MRRSPIPEHLLGTAIASTGLAAAGVSRSRSRRDDVEHPHRGVVAFPGRPDDAARCGDDADQHERSLTAALAGCRRFAPAMLPGQWFSGRTAAALWGGAIRFEPGSAIDVAVLGDRTPPRRPGVRGRRLSDIDVDRVHGLPVITAADAWCQLGATLPLPDLVALGDSLLPARRRAGSTTIAELTAAVGRHAGKRGMRRVRAALPLVREGVDSRPETLARLALIDAGLPEPEVGGPVVLLDGRRIHPDLVYRQQRVAIEHDGDGHRTSRWQWQHDVERYEALADAGWRVVRLTSVDLHPSPARLVARVRRALTRA